MDRSTLTQLLDEIVNHCLDTQGEPIDLAAAAREHRELPFDSLSLYEMASMVEDRIGVRLADDELFEAKSASALIDLVFAKVQAR